MKPTLYVFAGLPGTGKTTISRRIAQALNAAYLRIDTIEQSLRDFCQISVYGEGYGTAYRIAKDNLSLGLSVVADSCNPIALTRDEWESAARQSTSGYMHIEIICSDLVEHRRRVEARKSSIAGLQSPTWAEIESWEYDGWDRPRLRLDTAGKSEDEAVAELLKVIQNEN